MSDATPPDWYPDPTNGGRLRYWDGAVWTDRFADQEQVPEALPRPQEGVVTIKPRGSKKFAIALVAAIVGWVGVAALGVVTLRYVDAERAAESRNAYAVIVMCQRLSDDPTLIDDWRSAIDLDDSVTTQLVNLTATEASVRPLSGVLAPLAPRLLALAGTEPFELDGTVWGHRNIIEAAVYASQAAAAIDDWDYSDTRFRVLQGTMDGFLGTSHVSLEFGSAYELDILAAECA